MHVLTVDTFSLASSLANAQAGTAVAITGTGTGTQTVTPTALAGCTVKLQGSMDDSSYADLPVDASGDVTKIQTIAATGNIFLEKKHLTVRYVRAYYTVTAGQISSVQTTLVKS